MKQTLMMAAAVTAGLCLAVPADAQQRVRQGDRWVTMPSRTTPPQHRPDPRRWGERVNGRWSAGDRAPGGWNAYRRPTRGEHLPRYWMSSPDFRINDYIAWGLAAPPYGYGWVRYYDDAVLIDNDGFVWDSVPDVDWYGGAGAYSYSESHASVGSGAGADYAAPPAGNYIPTVDPDDYYDDGYAPGGGYVPPAADLPPPVVQYAPQQPYPPQPGACATQCGGSSTYYSGSGYYYVPSTTTTIIVQSGGMTTTTVTEEIVEEEVTTSYAPVRRTVRRTRPVSRVQVKRRR